MTLIPQRFKCANLMIHFVTYFLIVSFLRASFTLATSGPAAAPS